jgi:putative peptidoglycan lipid II flippase
MPLFAKLLDKTKVLFLREQKDIFKTSIYLMFILAATKITGFLFSAIVASQLGAGRELDLFLLANTIPEIIGNLILIGVVSAVFIPVLVGARTKGGDESFLRLFNNLLNISIVAFVLFALVLSICAQWFMPFLLSSILKPHQAYTPQEISQMVLMMRLLFIPQIVLGVSTFYSSGLNVFDRFLIPQIAPFLFNIGRIVCAYFLIPSIGGGNALVIGSLVGSILHLLIQVPLKLSIGIKHKMIFDLKDKQVHSALKFGLPRIVGIGAEYFASGIDRFIVARFVLGSVSVLDYATRLVSIPLSMFGLTFSTASFPKLSKLYQNGEIEKFRELFMQLVQQILFLSVPVTTILLVLRVPLVRLIFGIFGGAFSFDDTYLTAWTVAFFAFGLAFESVRSLWFRAFYAAGDTIRPLVSALFTVVFGIATGVLFTNYFSHYNSLDFSVFAIDFQNFFEVSTGRAAVGGIALSSSLIFTIEFFILFKLFSKYVCKLDFRRFLKEFFKKFFAALIMGLVMYSFYKLWGDNDFEKRTIFLILFTCLTSLIGLVVYLWSAFVLRINEFPIFLKLAQKVLPKYTKTILCFLSDKFAEC